MEQSIRITGAMKLVAAAKVRRAQSAVLNSRPFTETLASIIFNFKNRLGSGNLDSPFLEERDIKTVGILVMSGNRGLCGSFNTKVIKIAEERVQELKKQGIHAKLFFVGTKGHEYFKKRKDYDIETVYSFGDTVTAANAQKVTDDLSNMFLAGDIDKFELVYTNCKSLILQEPALRTILPLEPTGMETEVDELFKMTSKDGKIAIETDEVTNDNKEFNSDMLFEQSPDQLINAIMPLYLSSQILRSMQESIASEMAARMMAMESATDNAKKLKKEIGLLLNRARQAIVTQEIAELVGAAEASMQQ